MSLSIYILGVFVVVCVMLLSYFLGERSANQPSGMYESGIKGYRTDGLPFFAHYFLLAILFVIFDMESAFIYLWSSSVRELGGAGFFTMSIFIGMLVLGLIYAVRLGVLNLTKSTRDRLP